MYDKIISIRESDGNIVTLESHKILHSTSRLARKYAQNGQPDRYAVLSEAIKHPDGSIERGMFLSLILRPSFFPSQASLLGALSAVATVKALEEHTSKHIGLGWVSDIYCDGVRIGNTTIEGKLNDYTAYEYLIVSFSVRLDQKSFPPRLNDLIVEVFESGKDTMALIIAQNVLAKFFSLYGHLRNPSKFMDTYSEKFLLRGVKIKYDGGEKRCTCRVTGIDARTGALLINLRGVSDEHPVTSPSLVTIPKRIRVKRVKKEKKEKGS